MLTFHLHRCPAKRRTSSAASSSTHRRSRCALCSVKCWCATRTDRTRGVAQARHYVEKPESFISDTINGGVYLFDKSIFDEIRTAMDEKVKRHA